MDERIEQEILNIIPNITTREKDLLLDLFSKELCKAVRQTEWEASCGAFDQIMFSTQHNR